MFRILDPPSILVLLFILLPDGIRAQYDPVKNFCKRMDHQSAIAKGILYIDGGKEWFQSPNGGNSTPLVQGINTGLVTTGMASSWNWRDTSILQNVIEKHRDNGDDNDYVPSLVRGALWPNKNESTLYLYGGTTSMDNKTFPGYVAPQDDQPNFWKFDIKSSKWSPVTPARGSSPIIRLSDGAGVVAQEINRAFYFGGEIDNGSTPDTHDLPTPRFTPGLLEFDFETETVKNHSTSDLGTRAIAGSQMVYIPHYGTEGVLVMIGGELKSNLIVDLFQTRGDPMPMSTITFFDIGNQTWYQQEASEAVDDLMPESRTGHCLVAVPAPDMSSYNIYMYGGWNENKQLDDIWILSLPSFQWIEVYHGQSPRFTHTCHVVGNRQLLTVGGVGGPAGIDDKNCDWEFKSVAIYDLTTLQWGSSFTHNAKHYELPREITNRIGGNATGFAEQTAPIAPNHWRNAGLKALLMNPGTVKQPPEPTNGNNGGSKTKSKSHVGAIVGGVIAGVVVVALVIVAVVFLRRRREGGPQGSAAAELGDTGLYDSRKAEPADGQRVDYSELDGPPPTPFQRGPSGRMPVPEVQELQAAHVEREVERQELPGDSEWINDRKSAFTSRSNTAEEMDGRAGRKSS